MSINDILHQEIEKLINKLKEKSHKHKIYDSNFNVVEIKYQNPRDPLEKQEFLRLQLLLNKVLQVYAKKLLDYIKVLYKRNTFKFINHDKIKENNLEVLILNSSLYKKSFTIDAMLNINSFTINLWQNEINWIKNMINYHN